MLNHFEEHIVKYIIGIVVLILVGIGIAIYFVEKDQNAWEDWCHSQGGVVKESTKTVVTQNGNKTGVGTSTTYYCLTQDGRILDVR